MLGVGEFGQAVEDVHAVGFFGTIHTHFLLGSIQCYTLKLVISVLVKLIISTYNLTSIYN